VREAELKPVPDAPLLELRPAHGGGCRLILADLHLGLTAGEGAGTPAGDSSAPGLAATLLQIGTERSARGFVVAGDVKHPIVGTPPALRPVIFDFFSTLLAAGFQVEVVLGNHDVGLVRHLPREVTVYGAGGVVLDGVGIFHGHRWPSNRVLRSSRLIAGHLHPGVRLAPTQDLARAKSRCWVRVRFPPPLPPTKRRRRHTPMRAREMIVLPAFNPLCGAEALNRDRPSRGRSFLFHRFLLKGEARAYLLDGTDLGRVVTPKGEPVRR